MIDWSDVGTEVSLTTSAPVRVVWDLVTDLSRTPEWNRETRHTIWNPPASRPEVGATFRAVNRLGEREWQVECHVIVADPRAAFEWTVLAPELPSSTWWYRLRDQGGGTEIRHGFQHGPGPSGLRHAVEHDPEAAQTIIDGRVALLAANMGHTLGVIKHLAERSGSP